MKKINMVVQPKAGENFRVTIFKEILKQVEGNSLVDLGAGHCQYSIIANEMGFDVTAVDARTVRVPTNMPFEIKFLRANALDFDVSNVDIVCILGLLYHLSLDEQIQLLKKCAGKTTIIDTHLSETNAVTESGYHGKLYREAQDVKQMMKNPKASVTTLNSFWHTYDSFYQLLEDCGFSNVTIVTPEHHPYRTFFICDHHPKFQ